MSQRNELGAGRELTSGRKQIYTCSESRVKKELIKKCSFLINGV